MRSERGHWPEPQYPPVQCAGCRVTRPEAEVWWGFCKACWDADLVPDIDPL